MPTASTSSFTPSSSLDSGLREEMGNPNFLAHLEKVVKECPDYETKLAPSEIACRNSRRSRSTSNAPPPAAAARRGN
jgi:hypothetical protein